MNIILGTFDVGTRTHVVGGYFELGSEDSLMDSFLVDRWGHSKVDNFNKGSDELNFTKTYFNYFNNPEIKDHSFRYYFKKSGDLWVGGYEGDEGEGESRILLNPTLHSKQIIDELILSIDR